MFSVCFTGHRPSKLGGFDEHNVIAQSIQERLRIQVSILILQGCREFISGGALGVDTWAAEIVLEAKKQYPDIKLIIAKPFPSQDKVWIEESKVRFKKICDAADEVVNVSPDPYDARKMMARNEWMINKADYVVAVWDGSSGGTGNAVRYARKKDKQIILINPTKVS